MGKSMRVGVSYADDTACVRVSGGNAYFGNFEKNGIYGYNAQSLVRTVVIEEAGKVKQDANHVGL